MMYQMQSNFVLYLHNTWNGSKTISDLIDKALFQGPIKAICEECPNKVETVHTSSSLVFDVVPETLVIQIPRSWYTIIRGKTTFQKNHSSIDYFEKDCKITILGVEYSLVACLHHLGAGKDSGHYIVDSIRPTIIRNNGGSESDRIHTFDDGTVKVYESSSWSCMTKEDKQKRKKSCKFLMYRKI